jgi:hypothetical protein
MGAEGEGQLLVDEILVIWEYPLENAADEADGNGVWRVLRTHADDLPFD